MQGVLRHELINLDLEDVYVSSHYRFFNEEMETLPKDKLQALQLERLQAIVERAYTQNVFYRRLYDEAGVKPVEYSFPGGYSEIAFSGEKNRTRGLSLWDGFATPGTAGGALRFMPPVERRAKVCQSSLPRRIFSNWADLNARELWMTGFRPGDILMNCYGYGLPTGGFGFHYGALAMDVMAIPMGSDARQYDRMLDFILDFGVTGMCMTPSVGLYVGNKARERGIHFQETKLKIGLFGAEPWPWETSMKLEELLSITAYDEFGMTEFLGPGMTCECEVARGYARLG